jgi:hypothetical protein
VSDGLSVPLNAPPGGITPIGVQPGVTAGILFANTLVVFGNASGPFTGGMFVYQPGTTPGLGNPPIFSVTSGTQDPFGNPVVPTLEIGPGGQLNAGNTIINTAGTFTYSAFPPAANSLIAWTAPAAGTDAVGNAYLQGTFVAVEGASNWTATGIQSTGGLGASSQFITYYTTGLTETGWIIGAQFQAVAGVASPTGAPMQYLANGQGLLIGTTLANEQIGLDGSIQFAESTSTPSNKAGFATLFANAAAKMQIVDTSNLVRSAVRSSSAATSLTAGNNTTPTALTQIFSIAPDLAAGDLVEVCTSFNVQMGATTAETFALGFSLNGGAQITLNTIGAAIVAAGNTFSGWVHLCMRIITAGSSGNVRLWLEGGISIAGANILASAGSNAAIASTLSTLQTYNTTVANTLALFGTWGGAGGATQAFSTVGSTLKIH